MRYAMHLWWHAISDTNWRQNNRKSLNNFLLTFSKFSFSLIETFKETSVECPVNSVGLFCKIHCANGFKKDERGCDLPCKFKYCYYNNSKKHFQIFKAYAEMNRYNLLIRSFAIFTIRFKTPFENKIFITHLVLF